MSALGDTLRAAADHIERVGKSYGSYVEPNEDGLYAPVEQRPCCALGAIGIVTGYITDVDPEDASYLDFYMLEEKREPYLTAAFALAPLVPRAYPDDSDVPDVSGRTVGDIINWNDTEGRTAAEIATTMRTAALVQDKKENQA